MAAGVAAERIGEQSAASFVRLSNAGTKLDCVTTIADGEVAGDLTLILAYANSGRFFGKETREKLATLRAGGGSIKAQDARDVA